MNPEDLGLTDEDYRRFQEVAAIPEKAFQEYLSNPKLHGETEEITTDGLMGFAGKCTKKKLGSSYVASSIREKRHRRTKAEMAHIRDSLEDILREDHPQSVRGTFYQAVRRDIVVKTNAECNGTVGRLLTQLRRSGRIPFCWITDNTRYQLCPETSSGLQETLQQTLQCYRRDLWARQSVRVEVWCEKDAMAGLLAKETWDWQVPLFVIRGYPSITLLNSCAETIEACGKPTFIYYFGDYDPSGCDISRVVEKGIREWAPTADIHFERVAVLPWQIEQWNLPTRPTKKTDTRAKKFGDDRSVELDAIPAKILRQVVRECIEQHIDYRELNSLKLIEKQERETLESIAKAWGEEVKP